MSKEKATSKNKIVINRIILIIECAIIVACIIFSIFTIVRPGSVSEDKDKLRVTFLPVLTDSMNPTIPKNSLITTNKVPEGIIDLGTIVSFAVYSPQGNYLNTHRLVAYNCRDNKNGASVQVYYKKGITETAEDVNAQYPTYTIMGYITRGDKYTIEYGDNTFSDLSANRTPQSSVKSFNDSTLEFDEIVAIYKSHVVGIGGIIIWLQKPLNFFLVIMVPLILLFLYNVFDLVKNIVKTKVAKATLGMTSGASNSSQNVDVEAIARMAVAEYLAKQGLTPPVEATAKPVEATAEPVEATAEPVEATAEPVEATAKPVEATAEPVEATAKPVEATAKPVEATAEPVEATAKPVEATAKPVEATAEPVEATAEPVEADKKGYNGNK